MFRKLLDKLTAGNVLYFPGCMTKFVLKDLDKNYQEILKQLGVEFIMLKDSEVCCGSPIINAGFKQDFQDLLDKNSEVFKQHGVSKVITNCPGCYHILSTNFDLKVEHITQTVWKNITKLKLKSFNEDITYHDPCHLGRYSNIYEEPRYILKALDFNVVESKRTRENALCCGAGGGLRNNASKMASKIAKLRFDDVKTNKLITACPMCYFHLKENAPNNVEVLELSQVLV